MGAPFLYVCCYRRINSQVQRLNLGLGNIFPIASEIFLDLVSQDLQHSYLHVPPLRQTVP